jgi:hypothetical protein
MAEHSCGVQFCTARNPPVPYGGKMSSALRERIRGLEAESQRLQHQLLAASAAEMAMLRAILQAIYIELETWYAQAAVAIHLENLTQTTLSKVEAQKNMKPRQDDPITTVGTKFDDRAKERMQDEGGPATTPRSPAKVIAMPASDVDTSPLIAVFRDHHSAEVALTALRYYGIKNEEIGVAFGDQVVQSPANNPDTYRATGDRSRGPEFVDPVRPDSFREPSPSAQPAMPNTSGYDPEFESRQHREPRPQVMVSVQVTGAERQAIRDLLLKFGAAA